MHLYLAINDICIVIKMKVSIYLASNESNIAFTPVVKMHINSRKMVYIRYHSLVQFRLASNYHMYIFIYIYIHFGVVFQLRYSIVFIDIQKATFSLINKCYFVSSEACLKTFEWPKSSSSYIREVKSKT